MADNPYRGLAPHHFWASAVGGVPPFALDPVVETAFRIGTTDLVAAAGSCFAQHIARRLEPAGFSFHVAEAAPEGMSAEQATTQSYGVFSARYGNIYTAKQLTQLFDRAYGTFRPTLSQWPRQAGGFVDPFRPTIQRDGFHTIDELEEDRDRHLRCVRDLFETLNVFVFTLGLTESWRHIADDAIVPVAPGVAAGIWDEHDYGFVNSRAADIVKDLTGFVDRLRSINPAARIIITVSPVPLVATFENRHVLVSTSYSKAALRVAADEVCASRSDVEYFPAYEIITSPLGATRYFADDLRSVTEAGVDHVMRVFFRHFGETETAAPHAVNFRREIKEVEAIICDEDLIHPTR